MKKLLSVVMVVALMFSTVTAFASPDLELDVKVDYENGVINVEYTTDMSYSSKVTAVMYSGDANDILSYVRIYEGDAKQNEVINFSLDDIATGDYNVKVTLGGKNSASRTKQISIVNLDEADSLLEAINNALPDGIKDALTPVKDAIGIDFDGVYATNQNVVDAAFVSIKTNDYNGSFASLTTIATAFETAKAIAQTKLSVDESMLNYNIDKYNDLLGIDTQNAEYKKYGKNVIELLFDLKGDINDKKSAAQIFEKCVGFSAVINSKPSEGAIYLSTYAKQLGIEDYMTEYESSDKAKVARLVQEAECKVLSDLIPAFTDALDTVKKNEQNQPIYVPSGSGGGGGGSSFTGPKTNVEPQVPLTKTFDDIKDTEWAREYIETLATMGIINGYEDGTFKGNGTVTREEFVKMIVVAFEFEKNGATSNFKDVNSSNWAYEYISLAVDKGIISGVSDNEFGFGKGVTREDMAVILFRLAKSNGLEVDEILDVDPFADHDNISDYAREGVYVMRKTGVVNGFADGGFRPKATLTRAEAAKVICEMLKIKY